MSAGLVLVVAISVVMVVSAVLTVVAVAFAWVRDGERRWAR